MKTKILGLPGNLLLLLFILMLLLSFGSCSSKVAFQQSSVVPAAEGTVSVKDDKNNNYTIKISVDNLAAPERLQPPRELYIVWIETGNNTAANAGQIITSSGAFSAKLSASFETVSNAKPTRVFITAEDNPDTQYPGNQVVLSASNF
jgi:hypothetical protein